MMEALRKFDLTYLASPYSKYMDGPAAAFADVCRIAGRMLVYGVNVYSPIAHTHSIAIHANIDPLNHDVWLLFDAAIMAKADALCVAMMDGWEDSYGVSHEIEVFTKVGKPVFYLDPETMTVRS